MRYLPVYFPKTLKTLSPYNINRKKPFQRNPGYPQSLGFYLNRTLTRLYYFFNVSCIEEKCKKS